MHILYVGSEWFRVWPCMCWLKFTENAFNGAYLLLLLLQRKVSRLHRVDEW